MASKTPFLHQSTAKILLLVPRPPWDTKTELIFENNTLISKSGRVINVVERSFDASSEIIDLDGNFEAIVLVLSTQRTFSPNDQILQILGSTFGPKFTKHMILLFIPADTMKTNECKIKDSGIGFSERLDEEWVSIKKEPSQPLFEKVETNNPNLLEFVRENWFPAEEETQGHKQILNLHQPEADNITRKETWFSLENNQVCQSEEQKLEDLLTQDLKEYFKDIPKDRWVFNSKGEQGLKRLIEMIDAVVEETGREPLRHIALNEEKTEEAVHEASTDETEEDDDGHKAVTKDETEEAEDGHKAVTKDETEEAEDGNKAVTKDETEDDGPSKPLIIAKFGIAGMGASKGITDALF